MWVVFYTLWPQSYPNGSIRAGARGVVTSSRDVSEEYGADAAYTESVWLVPTWQPPTPEPEE